jgi:arylsulfatase A-like enzyme
VTTGLLGCAAEGPEPASSDPPPNIVLIVADDLGYGDVCSYSCKGAATPHIDSIGRNGVRFIDGHVTAPVCSPSRAGFITGRYQQRFGHEYNAGGAARCQREGLGLPTTLTTLADSLKAAGYATGMVGKSHLGSQPQFHPMQRGFDEFFGFLHGANLYLEPLDAPGTHFVGASEENFQQKRSEINPILRGTEPVEDPEYLTDAITREALSFIERHGEEPFFLYVPYNAPHTPLQVTDEYYQRFEHIGDERKRIFAAMVSALDDGVGKILEALEANELWRETLVVFFSDNGCATYTEACFNDPLLGGKLTLFEGGQRVPFFMQYPGVLPEGMVYDEPVTSLDIFPTAVNLAGGTLPDNLDGIDLVPYLTGIEEGAPSRALYWRNGTNSAVRKGPWKLVNLAEGRHVLLYNVKEDIGETNDLAAEHPEKVEELSGLLEQWKSELVDPLWPSRAIIPHKEGELEFDLYV